MAGVWLGKVQKPSPGFFPPLNCLMYFLFVFFISKIMNKNNLRSKIMLCQVTFYFLLSLQRLCGKEWKIDRSQQFVLPMADPSMWAHIPPHSGADSGRFVPSGPKYRPPLRQDLDALLRLALRCGPPPQHPEYWDDSRIHITDFSFFNNKKKKMKKKIIFIGIPVSQLASTAIL